MIGHYKNINIGETYSVETKMPNSFVIKTNNLTFIKVTNKGYNFLNTNTNKCIFKKHFYKSNKKNKFFISNNLIIKMEKTNPKLETIEKVKIEHIENIIKYSFKSNNTIEEINIINNTPIISNEQINKIDNHNISQIISDEVLNYNFRNSYCKEENYRELIKFAILRIAAGRKIKTLMRERLYYLNIINIKDKLTKKGKDYLYNAYL